MPTSEEVNYSHRKSLRVDLDSSDREAMKTAGYSSDQIRRIEQELKKAGLNA